MIEKNHPQLSVRKQSKMLQVNRNRLEPPDKLRADDLEVMRDLDELHTRWPVYGQRKLAVELSRMRGEPIGRKRVRRLMQTMGIESVTPKRRTTVPNQAHKKYPYLLRGKDVSSPDEVWCADITYIPMHRGFCYLMAVMDWNSRAVLSWKTSNTLDTRFCVEAFHEAVRVAGRVPDIFNTDQGCQFTSREWIDALEERGIRISMDGKGRWVDNVFIERLWRSLKYEDIYLRDYRDGLELDAGVSRWMREYNQERIHEALGYVTPWSVYRPKHKLATVA